MYNKKNFQSIFISFSFILFMSLNLNATEIKYGYPNQSIFIAKVNGKEQPITPMLNVAKVLFEKANIPWQATAYPAKRLFRNLKSGENNFTILVRASSLVDNFIFSQSPIYSTNLNVYSIGNKPTIHTKEDLIGKSIITIRGYSYGKLRKFINDPKNKINIEMTNTHHSALEMLRLGRADYLLDYASAVNDIIAKSSMDNVQTNKLSQLDIFLVLSKSYPNAQNVMTRLERIMESIDVDEIIKQSGTETNSP